MVFLDECPVCGRSRAVIKRLDRSGVSVLVNRSGRRAVELFNKLYMQDATQENIKQGSKFNMGWLWWDGLKDLWVRDFNNTKIFKL